MDKKAGASIIAALGKNPLLSTQYCETTKLAWDKLQRRYANKLIINKLFFLTNCEYEAE